MKGHKVFIAEGQRFCNRQFGEQRGERERRREPGEEGQMERSVGLYSRWSFNHGGEREERGIESGALLRDDTTLKGRPLGGN